MFLIIPKDFIYFVSLQVLSILVTILNLVTLIIIHVFNRKWYLLKLAFK